MGYWYKSTATSSTPQQRHLQRVLSGTLIRLDLIGRQESHAKHISPTNGIRVSRASKGACEIGNIANLFIPNAFPSLTRYDSSHCLTLLFICQQVSTPADALACGHISASARLHAVARSRSLHAVILIHTTKIIEGGTPSWNILMKAG